MIVVVRKRCPWSDHQKCAIYDRLDERTKVCCRGDGWIVVLGQHEGALTCGG
jgi:hypothetical protein